MGRSSPNVHRTSRYKDRTTSDLELLDVGLKQKAEVNDFADVKTVFTDRNFKLFFDSLFRNLIQDETFRNAFSNQVREEFLLNIGISIAEAIFIEIKVGDSFSMSKHLHKALTSIDPSSGPEPFGRVLAKSIAQILIKHRFLNSGNCSSLANTLAEIITTEIAVLFSAEVDLDVGLNAGLGIKSSVNTKSDADLLAAGGLGLEAGLNIGAGRNENNRGSIVIGGNTNVGAGIDLGGDGGLGLEAGLDIGAGWNENNRGSIVVGGNTNVGAGINLGADVGLNVASNQDLAANLKFGAGQNIATNQGLAASLNFGAGQNVATNQDLTANLNFGAGLSGEHSANLNAGLTENEISLETGASTGTNSDNKAGIFSDVIILFKAQLIKELLKENNFNYICSESVPITLLNSVPAAISQHLAKAFSVPRSSLLQLERNVLTLLTNKASELREIADIIASTTASILLNLNILTPETAILEATIAAIAISSGIKNVLSLSLIPGFDFNGNLYNSFFSVLNGLEKLPYIGTDVSRKFPPILQKAKSSSFAVKFVKELYHKLVSSNRFYDFFILGVPVSAYKVISNTLGKFMADAFGSPSSSFFAYVYTDAFIKTIDKQNYKTFAITLSVATTRALYLLGYFLSGNVNIQAAIASNAILRALISKSQQTPPTSEISQLSTIYGLPWTTQFTGIVPSDSLPKTNEGIGVDAELAANSKVGLGAELRLGGDFGNVATNTIPYLNQKDNKGKVLDLSTGVDTNPPAATNVNFVLGRNTILGLGLGLSGNAALNGVQLSVLNVLPTILVKKFYESTALYTSISIVGTYKVINLIAQGIAAEFGFPIGSVFSKSYDKNIGSDSGNNFELSMTALASATTDALAEAGILNTTFSLLKVDQLATAIVAKYSSLIATSLEASEWRPKQRCAQDGNRLYDQDQIQPPLVPTYNV